MTFTLQERLQKSSLKIILKNNYQSYQQAMKFLNMESLDQRREKLNLRFAKKCLKIENMKSLFPLNTKSHGMNSRVILKYKVNKAKTERYKNSPVISMQNLLNSDCKRNFNLCKLGTVHKIVPNP